MGSQRRALFLPLFLALYNMHCRSIDTNTMPTINGLIYLITIPIAT